jgi:hypothetical protein
MKEGQWARDINTVYKLLRLLSPIPMNSTQNLKLVTASLAVT